MATRSSIILELTEEEKKELNTDSSYASVYCHWDGYRGYVGRLLLQNYNDRKKIMALIKKGCLSSLGETIDDCKFYYPDFGDVEIVISFPHDIDTFYKGSMVCFLYLFNDKGWHWKKTYRNTKWFPLTMRNTQPHCY